jgi:hypothetical protein
LYGIFSFHTQRCVQKQAVHSLPPCTKNRKGSIIDLHCAAEAVVYGGLVSVCRGRGVLAPRSCYAFFIVLAFPIIPLSGSFFNLFYDIFFALRPCGPILSFLRERMKSARRGELLTPNERGT